MPTYHSNGNADTEAQQEGMTEKLRAGASEQFNQAKQRVADASDEIDRAVRSSVDQGTQFVRENPGIALAGAFGLGIVIGLSVSNRR